MVRVRCGGGGEEEEEGVSVDTGREGMDTSSPSSFLYASSESSPLSFPSSSSKMMTSAGGREEEDEEASRVPRAEGGSPVSFDLRSFSEMEFKNFPFPWWEEE